MTWCMGQIHWGGLSREAFWVICSAIEVLVFDAVHPDLRPRPYLYQEFMVCHLYHPGFTQKEKYFSDQILLVTLRMYRFDEEAKKRELNSNI